LKFCRALAETLTKPGLLLEDAKPSAGLEALQKELGRGPDLSVVIPVFDEEDNLSALYARLTTVLKEQALTYEIIFVDDGSRDQSPVLLRNLAMQDGHVLVVELARNFGHQTAVTAGLDQAQGKVVAVMDADLQDPPEVLPDFIAKWREGFEVVYAVRRKRKEGWLKRAAYAGFYRLLKRVANIDIPLDSGDFCVMDRRVVKLLTAMRERNRFVRGIRSWLGFRQVGVAYERQARFAGKPKYTLRRLLILALDGLISFSYMPLRFISLVGLGVSALSMAVALFYLVKKLVFGIGVPGFSTLVIAIFFLAGIQLVTMGVIGEYVARISEEVKQRPLYVVRRVVRREPSVS
jgi:dolichol-phosphate mannosyltransferase